MSAVLHLPVINTQSPYMLKDKPTDAFAPAFTAVNGRGSPPSPNDSPGANGVNARSSPHHHPDQRPAENGYRSGSHSTSPTNSSSLASPDSPNKRKRTDTPENLSASTSTMEAPQQRSLPPIDRPSEHERRWTAEPQPHPSYQIASRPMEPPHGSMPPMATAHAPMVDPATFDSSSSTNRNGVQVDVKKRKRQFANRTKTGCGTCRRRKKKCDEAKPECNNCSRGGFVCEGYASKVPWPKNGITKPPPPLQAKEQMSHDPSAAYPRCPACNLIHIPHCDPARSNGQAYPDPRVATSGPEGARTRPIAVDEPERKPPAPTTWTNGWSEPPPRTYAEQPPPIPAPYSQPPPPSHERPPSHDRHLLPQGPPPPPPRQHNPHMYQAPQPLNQPAGHPPAVPVDNHRSAPPQQPRQPPMALPTSAPPVPPQPHYVPAPRSLKTEKEKMLNGEPFLPYDEHLVDERLQCTHAVYGFNNLGSPQMHIGRGDRERMFKRIVQAGWINSQGHGGDRRVTGHYGGNVSVTMPFHCDYGYNLSIGDNVCIGPHCQFLDSARIAIGRNTKIGARVTISTIKTPTEPKQLKGTNGTEIAKEVHIGENVYIGDGVIIEAGVKIGHNAIIRSGSVVAGDIAPDVVATGNPAFGQPR